MIARVELRLRREALRERMREAVRREAVRLAGAALDEAEGLPVAADPDEKLTGAGRRDGLSRDV